ncbi:MAG TPA: MFS transporter [Acidimicrobiales bacterium]|nr:MFS transporter [Acidimicrobiales bacterium]
MTEARPTATPFSTRIAVFLGAEALSAIGSWATIVAIWGYAKFEYDASPAQVALFGLAFSLPSVLLGPLTGAVIDRIGPKATLAAARVLGIVASLLLLGADDFTTLALLSALHGVTFAFSMPALQSMPPRLVADEHLARTNALVSLTDELAIVFGPVAAGVSIALFGFEGAFVFDALTYALGLVVLPLVRLAPVRREDGDDDAPVRLRDALEGLRLISRSRVLRRTVGCTFAVHLLYGAALLCEPIYVDDVLHRSPDVFAALQTVFGIFLVLTGLVVARLGERLASFTWVAAGVATSSVTAIVYLGTPWVVVAFVGVALWGMATTVISGPSRTVLQRSSPQRAHGRVLATDVWAGSTGELVGLGLAGLLVSLWSVPWAILVLGAGVGAAASVLWLADRRDHASQAPVDEQLLAAVGAEVS